MFPYSLDPFLDVVFAILLSSSSSVSSLRPEGLCPLDPPAFDIFGGIGGGSGSRLEVGEESWVDGSGPGVWSDEEVCGFEVVSVSVGFGVSSSSSLRELHAYLCP